MSFHIQLFANLISQLCVVVQHMFSGKHISIKQFSTTNIRHNGTAGERTLEAGKAYVCWPRGCSCSHPKPESGKLSCRQGRQGHRPPQHMEGEEVMPSQCGGRHHCAGDGLVNYIMSSGPRYVEMSSRATEQGKSVKQPMMACACLGFVVYYSSNVFSHGASLHGIHTATPV